MAVKVSELPELGAVTGNDYVAVVDTSGTLTSKKVSIATIGNRVLLGNAATATKLAAPVTIAGNSFDGSANISITASQVGLGNVTNESKSTMFTNPTFTGTVTGVTKSMVGLGNVENTAISTWTGSTSITTLGTVTTGSAPASDVYGWAKAPTKPTYVASEVGLGNVTNESKATMFSNPTFTGTVTVPTPASNSNTTVAASTAFVTSAVSTAISNLVNSAPAALNTLQELATALGNDANFATTITNSIATRAPLNSPTFTGTVTIPSGASISGYAQSNQQFFLGTTQVAINRASGGLTLDGVSVSGSAGSTANITGGAANRLVYQTAASTTNFIVAPTTSDTYLKWDGVNFSWSAAATTAADIGLGNVTNESKATMFTNPTFTGTVSGVTATMVGLGNVTNESKSTMFTNPTFTGTVSGVTATMVGLGNVTNESKTTMFSSPTFTGTIDLNSSNTTFSDGIKVGQYIVGQSGQKLSISNQSNGIYLEGGANATIDLVGNDITFGGGNLGTISFYHSTLALQNRPTISGNPTFSGTVSLNTSLTLKNSTEVQSFFVNSDGQLLLAGTATTFAVTASGLNYQFDGTGSNPPLNLTRGITYTFNVNAMGHPFYIKTAATTGTGDQYTTGVTNNGTASGILTFNVPTSAPNTLYYQCAQHAGMGNTITISDPVMTIDDDGAGVTIVGPLHGGSIRSSTKTDTGVSGTYTMDCSLYDNWNITYTGATTFAFSNVPAAGKKITVFLFITQGTGGSVSSWPTGTTWPSGTAPTMTTTASRTDVISLTTVDGGTKWFATVVGQNYA